MIYLDDSVSYKEYRQGERIKANIAWRTNEESQSDGTIDSSAAQQARREEDSS